jgi:hypothetical protein
LTQFENGTGKQGQHHIHLQRASDACQNCDTETNSTPIFIPFSQFSLQDEGGAKEALSPAGSHDASDAQVFGEMM